MKLTPTDKMVIMNMDPNMFRHFTFRNPYFNPIEEEKWDAAIHSEDSTPHLTSL